MHVWLINPPVRRKSSATISAVVDNLFYNSPPLGLAYIAAVLLEDGHEVTLTDAPVERLAPDDLHALAYEIGPDLVGITATTPYFDRALVSAQAVRGALPSVPVCLGGPHMTANPDLLRRHREFSFGVVGEGERTMQQVVRRMDEGRSFDDVPGVVTRHGATLHMAAPRRLIARLDDLPLPARHLLPMDRYTPLPNDVHQLPKTSVITSRGCPFSCIFCDKSTFGGRYRSHSPGRVVEEMHVLEEELGVRDIAFVDSCFTPNRRRIEQVLDAMEADPPRATWTCSCRANMLDEELLRRMKALGCWRIRIAIESGNPGILETIRKGITREQFEATVRTADRVGLKVKGFFMVGHMGETAETIEDSVRFACSLPLTDITVQINTPLRGTALYEACREHGELVERDPSHFSFFEPVFVPRGMTAEQLLAAHRSFYRRFYLRPSVIARHLRDIRSLQDLGKYLRALPLVANVMFTNRGGAGAGSDIGGTPVPHGAGER